MLELIFLGALLALIAAQHFMHGRQVKAERAHHSQRERRLHSDLRDALDHARELQNQIVLLKVGSPAAVAVASTDVELQDLHTLDDEEAAQYEVERLEARQ